MDHVRNSLPRNPASKPKLVITLDSPYSEVIWPTVSANAQSDLLELLCGLLSPIGEYRSRHMSVSKGKREKRRRKRKGSIEKTALGSIIKRASPEVLKCLTIGFNTTTRYLEALARKRMTSPMLGTTAPASVMDHNAHVGSSSVEQKPLVAVFVPRAEQPSILHKHLPLLIKAASLASPSLPPIRLVALPKGAEARLSKALGIPRVGLVGLMDDSPYASQLIEFSRIHVPEVEIPWLQESTAGLYLPTVFNTIHTTTSTESNKRGSSRRCNACKE